MTRVRRGMVFGIAAFIAATLVVAVSGVARADDTDVLFADGAKALAEGRAGDAIVDFEALADRGVVDAAVSYDRGLAYAARVRASAELPGDLGRAAQAFEEARALTADASLAKDAGQALSVVRAEVARRRARNSEPADVERGPGALRSIVRLLPEDGWAILALVASVALGIALFLRGVVASRQGRAGVTIAWAVSTPLLVLGAALAFAARSDRLTLREGVIVSPTARPTDDKGLVVTGANTLPEAALVIITGTRPGWVHVDWGGEIAWLPSSAVRSIAR